MRTILIDDELHALKGLEYEIKQSCPEINIVAKISNPKEAKQIIEELNPDLVFLDIEMPWMNGFDVLQSLDQINFEIVFVTAYDQYAIRAFKFSAIDYLLKPVDGEELKGAVKKVLERKSAFNANHLDVLLQNLSSQDQSMEKIVLPTSDGLEFIKVNEIIRCASDSNYCTIYKKDGQQIFLAKTLKELETLLVNRGFIRVHNSHLISERFIKRYISSDGGSIELVDSTVIPISRNKKAEFLSRFKT